jgi:IMP dehydrogenase
MRKIELATSESVPNRVHSLKRSLEIIYDTKLDAYSHTVPIERLFPTEDFLENDKLALVFMKTVNEGYDVPIITVEKATDYFVLDGHHRSFIYVKLRKKTIKARVLKFPQGSSYREVSQTSFQDLPIKEVSTIEDPILKAWARILNIMRQYEALYHIHFHMERKDLLLENIHPTQPQILKPQLEEIERILVPIACIAHKGEYYVLDGHARCIRARQLGLESIQAIILCPEVQVDYGIVKTAQEMKLQTLKDVTILNGVR